MRLFWSYSDCRSPQSLIVSWRDVTLQQQLWKTLLTLTFALLLQGVGVGIALRSANMTLTDKKYFTFPGELLLRMLQCLVLPLITSSVITGQTLSCVLMLSHISYSSLLDCMIKILLWIIFFTSPVCFPVLRLFDLINLSK